MARKSFKTGEELRKKVKQLAGLGIPQQDICRIAGCSEKTLRKHFRDELDRASIEANAVAAGYLYKSVQDGNVAAQIFWMKCRGGWRERPAAPEKEAIDPAMQAKLDYGATIILPSNGRGTPEEEGEIDREYWEYIAWRRTHGAKSKRKKGLPGA